MEGLDQVVDRTLLREERSQRQTAAPCKQWCWCFHDCADCEVFVSRSHQAWNGVTKPWRRCREYPSTRRCLTWRCKLPYNGHNLRASRSLRRLLPCSSYWSFDHPITFVPYQNKNIVCMSLFVRFRPCPFISATPTNVLNEVQCQALSF